MIRIAVKDDYSHLIDIWLEASIKAHYFIDSSYWINNAQKMKDTYLPSSETWVLEVESHTITGFVSVKEDHIAALFISPAHQGEGCGSTLLQFLKTKYNQLSLNVYALNEQAVHFYQKHGFRVVEEMLDENTGTKDCRMEWKQKYI